MLMKIQASFKLIINFSYTVSYCTLQSLFVPYKLFLKQFFVCDNYFCNNFFVIIIFIIIIFVTIVLIINNNNNYNNYNNNNFVQQCA